MDYIKKQGKRWCLNNFEYSIIIQLKFHCCYLFEFPLFIWEGVKQPKSLVPQIMDWLWILYDPGSSTMFYGHHALCNPSIPLLIQTNLLQVSPKHFIFSHNSMNVEGLISDNNDFFCFSPPIHPSNFRLTATFYLFIYWM